MRYNVQLAFILLGLLFATGCTQFDLTAPKMPWDDDEEELVPPQKIVAFWSDTVMHQQGQPAVRGFGGRIFFYPGEESNAIEVDGAVIVYAFDADHKDPSTQKPEKKFVFKAEHLASHLSQSKMGPSYSLWLPWDGVQGETRNISLVVRYEGTDGTVAIADPVSKLLPGASTAQVNAVLRHETLPVRTVSHEKLVSSPSILPSGDTAKTAVGADSVDSIDLPPSFVRRLQQSMPSDEPASSADRTSNPTYGNQSPPSNRDSVSPRPAEAFGEPATPGANPPTAQL